MLAVNVVMALLTAGLVYQWWSYRRVDAAFLAQSRAARDRANYPSSWKAAGDYTSLLATAGLEPTMTATFQTFVSDVDPWSTPTGIWSPLQGKR